MHRIISLIASATEIVNALGFGEQMVGRSHECDYPAMVMDLPVCTGPKFRTDGSSYAIDQRVRAILQEGLSVYRVDADMLEKLKPTHIFTQSQCEVCAVSEKDLEAAACQLISSQPEIVSFKPDRLEDIWTDIIMAGTALGAENYAQKVVNDLSARIAAITERAKRLERKTVACIEWIEPLMIAGCWMPQLIELCGATSLLSGQKLRSKTVSWLDLVVADPDFIIVSPCGFDIERTLSEMPVLSKQPQYGQLRAVKAGNVVVVDGNQYMNRPGPRVVESLEILAEIIHPGQFDFAHLGTGWVRYSA